MRIEAMVPMQARLEQVRELLLRMGRVNYRDDAGSTMVRALKEEEVALGETLFGEDPLCRRSLHELRELYLDSDLVLKEENGQPRVLLGGNESWAFADVVIGDDYGELDFIVTYAIWRYTGALYRVIYGEVSDDPFYVPPGSSYTGTVVEPRWVANREIR